MSNKRRSSSKRKLSEGGMRLKRLFRASLLMWMFGGLVTLLFSFKPGFMASIGVGSGDWSLIFALLAFISYVMFIIALLKAHLSDTSQNSYIKIVYWAWALIMTLTIIFKTFIYYIDNYTNSTVEQTYTAPEE
ncbi:MAG TPA: hypothetical protein VL098_08945 [Flavipsychrobacter sp.]|nr:hypothetical protein [Flavipsychrobacter sp.]